MTTIIETIRSMAGQVIDGETSALKTYIEFKALEKELKAAIDTVQKNAIDEAGNYGKSFKLHGASIEVRNAASRWEFKNVHQVVEAQKTLKQFEELAKQAASGAEVYDKDGVRIEPAVKIEGKTTIAVSL
jgi:hypothetical protein